jgi:hypothetical protein
MTPAAASGDIPEHWPTRSSLHPLGEPGRACRQFGESGGEADSAAEGGAEAEEATFDDASTKGGFG